MDAERLFAQADVNQDQRLDLNEFRGFLNQDGVGGAGAFGVDNSGAGAFGVDNSGAGAFGVDNSGGGNVGGAGAFGGGNVGGAGAFGGDYGVVSGIARSVNGGPNLTAAQLSQLGYKPTTVITPINYPRNAEGYFNDPNPIHQKGPAGGNLTYQQNIQIRFLRPPSVPGGTITIQEEARPLADLLPPRHIRQPARAPPPLGPIHIRERPPLKPPTPPPQRYIYTLPGQPVPPQTTVTHREAAAPPKPRDIYMERWLPYRPAGPPRVIVERAKNIPRYGELHNVIIQYGPAKVQVMRKFQRLGIEPTNPDAYIQQYGATLLDSAAFVQMARSLGVVEDISVPNVADTNQSVYPPSSGFGLSVGNVAENGDGAGLTGSESAVTAGAAGFDSPGLAFGGALSTGNAVESSGGLDFNSNLGADVDASLAGSSGYSYESGSYGATSANNS